MSAVYKNAHFNREAKEVTFLLGDAEFPQRATLGVLQRIEARFGPVAPLIARIARQDFTIAETAELIGMILRDHQAAPKKGALVEAMEPVGLNETMGALVAFLTYGIASDMPASAEPVTEAEGNG
jgi:hypothetical protein